MKKIIFLILLCLLLVFSLSAEEKNVYEEFDQALGGFAGQVSGIGLSYQQWFGSFGVEAIAGFSYDGGDSFDFNVGAQAQYMVYYDIFSDWLTGGLYLWGGGVYGSAISNTAYIPAIGLGFGIGIEPVLFEHFSIPIEFGYGGNWRFDSIVPVLAGVQVQGGFRFRF